MCGDLPVSASDNIDIALRSSGSAWINISPAPCCIQRLSRNEIAALRNDTALLYNIFLLRLCIAALLAEIDLLLSCIRTKQRRRAAWLIDIFRLLRRATSLLSSGAAKQRNDVAFHEGSALFSDAVHPNER